MSTSEPTPNSAGLTLAALSERITAFMRRFLNGRSILHHLNQKPRRYRLPGKTIDRIVLVYLDGKVTARCYSGKNYTDATITPQALALLVSDGAKIMLNVHQKMANWPKQAVAS